LQVVDPEHLPRNAIPPPVHIERVVADRKPYRIEGRLQLPPLTRDLEIDYVGLSFVAPQKVQFRYRLDGRDAAWQEPDNRRQAFYSDLRPGTYRFHVIASNNDGLWNEEGATLEIFVAPTWYQTRAFQMLSIVAVVLTAWLAYRLRMRQMARALSARFDERLEERTQLARDLHDTLLQTLQGSKIVADTALDRPGDAPTLARALQQVSAWMGKATEEGRATVLKLRRSAVERNDLVEAFQRAIEDCKRRGTIDASLTVTGETAEMHPVVRDEIYRIGYEAIRNAYTHSRGSRVVVALGYGRDFTLRVTDDGVGIDSITAERGREGHFGLRGMRERAARISATLSVNSDPVAGTTVVVTVPGWAVFRKLPSGVVARIRAALRGQTKTGPAQ
jgi:signal transduction histidine kinase